MMEVKHMKLTINIEVEITKEIVENIIGNAFYGMNYWAEGMYIKNWGEVVKEETEDLCSSELYTEILCNGGSLRVVDLDDEEYELNASKLCNGIKTVLRKYSHLADMSNLEEVDSQGAECIIQCALYGDIIYG